MNLTIKEVSLCTGWGRSWIFHLLKNGTLKRVGTQATERNGRPPVIVALDSLPPWAREKHIKAVSGALEVNEEGKQDIYYHQFDLYDSVGKKVARPWITLFVDKATREVVKITLAVGQR